MWELLRNAAAAVNADVKNPDSLRTAAAVCDMLTCRRGTDECLAELESIAAMREKCGGYVMLNRPVPNEETAFVMTSTGMLLKALHEENFSAAGILSAALADLPELTELCDEAAVEDFNRKYGCIPPLQLIRK